jgi:hypothetical protein
MELFKNIHKNLFVVYLKINPIKYYLLNAFSDNKTLFANF